MLFETSYIHLCDHVLNFNLTEDTGVERNILNLSYIQRI